MSEVQSRGIWEKLSLVAVHGAAYDSPKDSSHPECSSHRGCSDGTRVAILDRINGLLEHREKNQLIWLHGTAGVGKSAVAYTVADGMRGLKMTEDTKFEKRLAGTFFFSRNYMGCGTTEHFFATLAYQLGCTFHSIQEDLKRAIRYDPALLIPSKSRRDQMEELFLRPLRQLQTRLKECPPLVFVIDGLDECKPKTAITDLISLLSEALRERDLPVTHILLTSRSEEHIQKAIQKERETHSGEVITISLDEAYVDGDISIFFHGFFNGLLPDFPLPSKDQVAQLTSRAGGRFIVASTMTKFIEDTEYDPRDQLQLMLGSTSGPSSVMGLYELYDRILSTCADVKKAYSHLSIIAALADPLPISEIVSLLGPRHGKDTRETLKQLRPFMDVPADSSLPVVIHHTSVRDYVSDPSNCHLTESQNITPPHCLLADSCLRLMKYSPDESTCLLAELLKLESQSQAMESNDPTDIKLSLPFLVQPPEPLQVLIALLWHRDHHRSDLHPWLDNLDGYAWLQTSDGRNWLQTEEGQGWLQKDGGKGWLRTQGGKDWRGTQEGSTCLLTENWQEQLHTLDGQKSLQTASGREWLQTQTGREWLQTQIGQGWLQIPNGQEWLQTSGGREWLQMQSGQDWLQSPGGQELLRTQSGREWLQTSGGREWLQTQNGRDWLQTPHGRAWKTTPAATVWVTMEEFTSAFEAISQYNIPASSIPSAFQAIQRFRDLPDFLMFPAFLALRHQYRCTFTSSHFPNIEVIHAMITFASFGNKVWERSQLSSGALKYANQNWAFHLSQTSNPQKNPTFQSFWSDHLLTWFKRQWCLKGLQSCLAVLSEGQKLAI